MKIIKAFSHAFSGLIEAFKTEQSFKLEVLIGIPLAIIFSWFFWPLTAFEILLVIITCLLVFLTELINTSIENIWDFIHPEKNEIVKRSKDIASSAVLMSLLISLSVAVFIALIHLGFIS